MILKLKSLKDLPYKDYTATLLSGTENIDMEKEDGYLYITSTPIMIILFKEFVSEINSAVIPQNGYNK